MERDFIIYPILEENEGLTITCSLDAKVITLKNLISQNIRCDVSEFDLFHDFNWMSENAYLNSFVFVDNSYIIHYVTFTRFNYRDSTRQPQTNGSFCEVFKIPGLALKVYNYSQTSDALKPLIRELINFAKIGEHGRFVKLLGFYRDGERFCIEMEDMSGGSLEQYIKERKCRAQEIRKWATQILEGLQYLHSNRIIFRDLKTSNILLDENKNIKMSGLSLSRYFSGCTNDELRQGIPQTKTGTCRYMAPEVCNNQNYGINADVWSFGACLVEMATGQPPLQFLNEVRARREIEACTETIHYKLPEGTSPLLARLIERCLKRNPDDRPTVEVLLKDDFLTHA